MNVKTRKEAVALYRWDKGEELTYEELKLVMRILNRTIRENAPKRIVDEIPTADIKGATLLAETLGYTYKIGNRFYKEIVSDNWRTSDTNKAEAIPYKKGFILKMVRYA